MLMRCGEVSFSILKKIIAFPSLTLKSISDNNLGMEYLLFLQMPQIHGERHLLGMSW